MIVKFLPQPHTHNDRYMTVEHDRYMTVTWPLHGRYMTVTLHEPQRVSGIAWMAEDAALRGYRVW